MKLDGKVASHRCCERHRQRGPRTFAREGAHVVIADLNLQQAQAGAEEIGSTGPRDVNRQPAGALRVITAGNGMSCAFAVSLLRRTGHKRGILHCKTWLLRFCNLTRLCRGWRRIRSFQSFAECIPRT